MSYSEEIKRYLAKKITKLNYDSWVEPLDIEVIKTRDSLDLTLKLENKFDISFFQTHYNKLVLEALPKDRKINVFYKTKSHVAIQLPLWRESKRSAPNEIIRSALFNVRNRQQPKQFFQDEELASIGKDITILYSGPELRQDDEDVWLQALHLARNTTITTETSITFAPSAFRKALKWPKTGFYNKKLKDCLTRLSTTSLTIHSERFKKGQNLSLVRKFNYEVGGQTLAEWELWFEPEIVALFGGNKYSEIDWAQRLGLPPLAKWLHTFYQSHKKPYPLKVESLMKACGTKAKTLKGFRRSLRDALDKLVSIDYFTSYEIDKQSDLVKVVKKL